MRRLIVYTLPFFISGILIYNKPDFYIISAVISALFLISCLKKLKMLTVFCAIFLFCGMLAASVHSNIFEKRYEMLKKLGYYEGYVVEKNSNICLVKNYQKGYRLCLILPKEGDFTPGDYIKFTGEIREKPQYKKIMMNSMNIDSYISNDGTNILKTKKYTVASFPVRLKYRIIDGLLKIDNKGGGFICGIILGYDDKITYDDKNDFKELGISHILAVSGFNIGVIYYFIRLLTKNCEVRIRYFITIFVCFIYTLLGGFEPSIFRAFVMIVAATAAKMLDRLSDELNIISFTAFVMLVCNSFYIYNIGFLLSFSATFGIILLKDEIDDFLPERINILRNESSVSISVFIATFPIVIWYSGFISFLSIIINLIISPLIVFITILSFICSVLYAVSGISFILYPAVCSGAVFVKMINILSKVNLLWIPGRPTVFFIILYYMLIVLLFGFISIKAGRHVKNSVIVVTAVLMIFSLIYHTPALKIHILNVGQGDSIFIETPKRQCILIDTGPKFLDYNAARDKVIPYILRHGYNKIDMLIITHFHFDHAGGIDYLINNKKIEKVVTYKKPENISLDCIEVSQGDTIKIDDVLIDVLFPYDNKESSDDENETCLVMDLKYKNFSILLASDATKEVMDCISGNYDVFKVPHHGAIGSFSEKMLDMSRIGTAVISVGKNNFGHPSDKLLSVLKDKGIEIFRTDESGDLTIETQGQKYKILFE